MFNVNQITQWSLAALLSSSAALMGGCDDPPKTEVGIEGEDGNLRFWTGYTSEEYPPLTCPPGYAVRGADCTGDYCDNVAVDCGDTNRSVGEQSWTPYFSEEGDGLADEGHCVGTDRWMTGLACSGGYCDNLSLLCSQLIGTATGGCFWSGWYSEEQSPFVASDGYYLEGIECSGDYCDNKRYQYCWMY